ncbi:hypothetical protein PM082_000346 [Marasmius tenuissimus]|nr:hypothetical protein PM082_000346 [Marasmius tenuissimus]
MTERDPQGTPWAILPLHFACVPLWMEKIISTQTIAVLCFDIELQFGGVDDEETSITHRPGTWNSALGVYLVLAAQGRPAHTIQKSLGLTR